MPRKGNFLECVTLNGQKEVLVTSNVLWTLNKEVRVLCEKKKSLNLEGIQDYGHSETRSTVHI